MNNHQQDIAKQVLGQASYESVLCDEQSERAVIGGAIDGFTDMYPKLRGFIAVDDFFILRNRYIWRVCERLYERQIAIDMLTVLSELEAVKQYATIGGDAYLMECTNTASVLSNIEDYARIVKALSIRRQGVAILDAGRKRLLDGKELLHEIIPQIHKDTLGLMALMPNRTTKTGEEAVDDVGQYLSSGNEVKAIYTGWEELDELIIAMFAQNIYAFIGDSGIGKSRVLLSLALNIAPRGKRVAYFSTEMTVRQQTIRLIEMLTGVPSKRIVLKQLDRGESDRVKKAMRDISDMGIFLDHDDKGALTPGRLRTRLTQLVGTYGLDLVIIDHLHDMKADPVADDKKRRKSLSSEGDELGEVAEALKEMSVYFNVPIAVAAQAKQDVRTRQDKRPYQNDVRYTYRLTQLAQAVIGIYRDNLYNPATESPNTVELIVDKVRDYGGRGTAYLRYDSATHRIENGQRRNINLAELSGDYDHD